MTGTKVIYVDLPVPSLEGDYKKQSEQTERPSTNEPSSASKKTSVTPSRSRTSQPNSYSSFPDTDPWGSPELHKGHNHSQESSSAPRGGDGSKSNGSRAGQKQSTGGNNAQNTWDNRHGSSTDPFRDSGIEDTNFRSMDEDGIGADTGAPGIIGRNAGSNRDGRDSNQANEIVTITAMPEKEGMFLFQHRNYEVSIVKRNSKVTRRYSDFVWLLDCLHKRYPFRQLPLLPPKRVASKSYALLSMDLKLLKTLSVNGNHLAADNHFLEKRRKGLVRFINALVRHPVLSQDQLVAMFLTVPTVNNTAGRLCTGANK